MSRGDYFMFGSKFLGFVLAMEANDYLTFPNSVVLSIFFFFIVITLGFEKRDF